MHVSLSSPYCKYSVAPLYVILVECAPSPEKSKTNNNKMTSRSQLKNFKYGVLKFTSDGKLGLCPNSKRVHGLLQPKKTVTVDWNSSLDEAEVTSGNNNHFYISHSNLTLLVVVRKNVYKTCTEVTHTHTHKQGHQ